MEIEYFKLRRKLHKFFTKYFASNSGNFWIDLKTDRLIFISNVNTKVNIFSFH
jgi:hypothetical protein